MEELTSSAKNNQESDIVQSLRNKITELDRVISLLPGHVYWMNDDNVYLGCNENLAAFLKLSSRKEIVGKHLKEVVPQQDEKILTQNHIGVIKGAQRYEGEEVCDIPGHEGIYLTQKVPLKNDHNQVIGLLGISFNITDRKNMELQMQEAKEKAELANQTKTEFIRNMEHDIRTPLCGIKSVATYLNAMEKDTVKKDFLNDLEIATNELLNYLDNIVEFSQLNTGTVPFILKEFNLEHTLRSILKLESAAAKHKGLDLIIDYPETIPSVVLGDRFRLHRILINLINNAIKFTQQGYVKVSVRSVKHEKKGEILLEIAVEDTGIGIEKKHHNMIYEKFTRCDPSNKGLYKGTGLGLWIVNQFVNDLQGQVTLKSEAGKGSLFTCYIPFKLSK
jgi:two-component system, OmpR family, aerobic respiration control sensor histidine kinase ArcB